MRDPSCAQVRLLEPGLQATACYVLRCGEDAPATAPVQVTVDKASARLRGRLRRSWGLCIAEAVGRPPADGSGGGSDAAESSDDGPEASSGAEATRAWGDGDDSRGSSPADPPELSLDGGPEPLRLAVLGVEAAAKHARALAGLCEEALAGDCWPTTAEADARLLSELGACGSGNEACGEGGGGSVAAEHLRLAVEFRLARKRLLGRAAGGLRLQAEMLTVLAGAGECGVG